MSNVYENAYRLIEAAKNVTKEKSARWRIKEVSIHCDGYKEPGYSGTGVALGNWNDVTRWNNEKNRSEVIDNTPSRLAKALEKLGIELEWGDEWTACSQCGGLVRTQPDSYSWTRSYTEYDGEVTCHECLDPEEHLESLEGDCGRANTIDKIDPAEHGYVLVKDDFEQGFYDGQDASPKLIAEALEKQGIYRYVFNIEGKGQFDVRFSVYIHESEKDKLNMEDFESEKTDGPSVSGALKCGLDAAMEQMKNLSGNGIKYASVNSDGTANVREVSPEEFIEGIKR